jgi:hypothetical protein
MPSHIVHHGSSPPWPHPVSVPPDWFAEKPGFPDELFNGWRAARARFSLRCSERGADHWASILTPNQLDGGALAPKARSERGALDLNSRSISSDRLDLQPYGP